MSSPTITTEDALWLFVGELPTCQHRREQASDWFQDSAAKVDVTCPNCNGDCVTGRREGYGSMMESRCWRCHGRGEILVLNRAGQLADALVKTKHNTPSEWATLGKNGMEGRAFIFERSTSDLSAVVAHRYLGRGPFASPDIDPDRSVIHPAVFDAMDGEVYSLNLVFNKVVARRYKTAAEAIRALCLGWCAVSYSQRRYDG